MTTYREIVGSISSTLRQVYQERKIEPYLILYWVLTFAGKLKAQHIENSFTKRSHISGDFITPFTVNIKQGFNQKYFDLPGDVINYKAREGGIDYLTYNLQESGEEYDLANNQFTRISAGEVTRLYYNSMEKPAPDNPYFYRIGDRIFLLGIETIRVDTLKTGLILGVSMEDIDSLDDKLELDDHLIPVLMMEVLNLAQFGMAMPDDAEKVKQLKQVADEAE